MLMFLLCAAVWYGIGILVQLPIIWRLNEIYPEFAEPWHKYGVPLWFGGILGPFAAICTAMILFNWRKL